MKIDLRAVAGKRVFVGIDVHKTKYSLAAVVDGEVILKVGSMPADTNKLIEFLKKRFPESSLYSVYEAGFSGFVLHRALVAAGIKSIVINAASIEIAVNNKVKTDKRDAIKMASHLAKGMLRGIRIPTPEQELARVLTRTRAQLVKERSRVAVQIKSKLMQFGLIAAEDKRVMTAKLLCELKTLDMPRDLAVAISALSEIWQRCHEQVKKIELEMARQAKSEAKLEDIYQSVPGIGPVIGRTLANELGDMTQFQSEGQLFSFVGLTPCEYSSGEGAPRRGRITKQGSGLIRGMLVEAAWMAMSKDPDLKKVYERLKVTRGGKRAIVAVARRLVGRLRSCLQRQVTYELGYNSRIAA